jgi:hypothetical protein
MENPSATDLFSGEFLLPRTQASSLWDLLNPLLMGGSYGFGGSMNRAGMVVRRDNRCCEKQ